MEFKLVKQLLVNGVDIKEDKLEYVLTIDYIDEIIKYCDLNDDDIIKSIVEDISVHRNSFEMHKKIFNALDDDTKVKYIEQVLNYEEVKKVIKHFDDVYRQPDPVNQLLFEYGKEYFKYTDYDFEELAQTIGGWQYFLESLKEGEVSINSDTIEGYMIFLTQIPENILLDYAEDIADAIDAIYGYMNNTAHKQEVVQKFIDAGYDNLVKELFEFGISGLEAEEFGIELDNKKGS